MSAKRKPVGQRTGTYVTIHQEDGDVSMDFMEWATFMLRASAAGKLAKPKRRSARRAKTVSS